jgi:hypothetical protein
MTFVILGEILGRVVAILAAVTGVTALLQALGVAVGNTALQTTLVDTETDVITIQSTVLDSSFGLAAIEALMVTNQTALLAAIAAVQQTGSPVTLPTSPPPGYGGGSSDLTADQVWEYVVPGQEFTTGGLNAFAGNYARSVGNYSLSPLQSTNYFAIAGDLWDVEVDYFQGGWPIGDPTTILPTDTLSTWLERESGLTGWTLQSNGTLYFVYVPDSSNPLMFVCTLDAVSFAVLQAAGTVKSLLVPPVWPGIANVSLGSAYALADGLVVPGPMDGILVAIETVSYPIGYYPFGAYKSFVKVGGVIFQTDTDYAEMSQPLGLNFNVITPKTMVQASAAIFRVQSGVTGVVTPWSRV